MANRKRLLLVDGDQALREMLKDQLARHAEFAIETAGSAARALQCVQQNGYDVIILDIGLPDMDGRELCRLMRGGDVKAPIIMLAGAGATLGLDSGASDCVTKPFRLGVLLTRIRVRIRQHERSHDAVFAIGPYSFQPSAKLLIDERSGRKIRLTDKETAILKCLYRAGNRVVSRSVLLDEIWGYRSGVTTHTLETHVYRLRKKIEPDRSQARLLLTEAGGYRLSA